MPEEKLRIVYKEECFQQSQNLYSNIANGEETPRRSLKARGSLNKFIKKENSCQ